VRLHLKDLPERNVYLKLEYNFSKEFFRKFEDNFNISIIKEFGYKTDKLQWKQYKRSEAVYPIFFIKQLSKRLEKIDSKFSMDSIEKHIASIKVATFGRGSRGKVIKKPIFPVMFNNSISRIMAHTLSDGNIIEHAGIRYTNSNIYLINSFVKDVDVLGEIDLHQSYDSDAYRVIAPKIVRVILETFGLNKTDFAFMSNIPKENKMAFVQAVFDDEGTVDLRNKKLSMASINKPFLLSIQEFLSDFGMISRILLAGRYLTKKGVLKQKYVLEISGYKNMIKFYKLIKLDSVEKQNKLKELINFYNGKKIRSLRGENMQNIMNLLNVQPLTKYDIMNKLNLSESGAKYLLSRLKNQNKIISSGKKKNIKHWVVLWKINNS